jgi:hypothetical protein
MSSVRPARALQKPALADGGAQASWTWRTRTRMTLSSGRRARVVTSAAYLAVRYVGRGDRLRPLTLAQTLYYRRIRDRNCYIGEEIRQPHSIERQCQCTEEDFEW